MLCRLQITEEGSYDDRDETPGDEAARRTSSRVQFATDVDKSPASDASTPAKDAVQLQPCTTEDGYLTPTTRATADGTDVSYLNVLDSPTEPTAGYDLTVATDARKRILIQ